MTMAMGLARQNHTGPPGPAFRAHQVAKTYSDLIAEVYAGLVDLDLTPGTLDSLKGQVFKFFRNSRLYIPV
jgi:hypothetical protein